LADIQNLVMPRPGVNSKLPRSLVVLLQALVGSRVTIETRGGTVVRGALESVDHAMNLTLSDVTVRACNFPALFLAGRQIVFVHLPDEVDVGREIDLHVRNRSMVRL
jgi:small nuclear ribonucleoprotein (snRNP)-like protein